MTRDDIIRLAHKSHIDVYGLGKDYTKFADALERFAALVAIHAAAKEREWMQDINKRLIAEAVAAERKRLLDAAECRRMCEHGGVCYEKAKGNEAD